MFVFVFVLVTMRKEGGEERRRADDTDNDAVCRSKCGDNSNKNNTSSYPFDNDRTTPSVRIVLTATPGCIVLLLITIL